jgi:hypothetical protein
MHPADEPTYLREKAAQFRQLAAQCDAALAAKLYTAATELETKADRGASRAGEASLSGGDQTASPL